MGWARFQLLLTALLFSTGGAAIKSCSLSSWQVAGFRSGIAAMLLALFPAARRGWTPGTLVVGVAYASTVTLYVSANKLTTAANAIFLQSTAPLYIVLLAPLLLKEQIHRREAYFLLLVAAGMTMFFVGVDEPVATAPDPFRGNLLGAAAGLSWAATVMGLRWLGTRGYEATLRAIVAGNVIAFLVCLPGALPVEAMSVTDASLLIYLGVFQIGIAYLLMSRGIRHVSALEASLLLLVEPALSPVWAWLVHGERPGSWAILGGALILGATAAKTWIDARRPVLATARRD
jgi:DME family drug/metabolite transporter